MKQILLLMSALLFGLGAYGQTQNSGVTDATVDLPSGKVFYRDSGGKGVPVVFLHAGSGNSMLWEYQIPAFTKAGYRFIAIDYRGAGSTTAGPGGGNTAAYINELMAKLGIQKFHLVGTAAGGGAALQYALANPDKLRSVTVSNSIGNVQDKEYTEMGNRIRPAQAFNQLPLDFRELGPSYRAANPEGVKRWLELSSEGNTTAGPGAQAPGMGAGGPPQGGSQAAPSSSGGGPGGGPAPPGGAAGGPPGGAGGGGVTWEKLAAFKVPTLLMTGDADLYTPPSVLRMFTARMKQAESAIIPESGHSSYWENPEAFNKRVLEFIKKH